MLGFILLFVRSPLVAAFKNDWAIPLVTLCCSPLYITGNMSSPTNLCASGKAYRTRWDTGLYPGPPVADLKSCTRSTFWEHSSFIISFTLSFLLYSIHHQMKCVTSVTLFYSQTGTCLKMQMLSHPTIPISIPELPLKCTSNYIKDGVSEVDQNPRPQHLFWQLTMSYELT